MRIGLIPPGMLCKEPIQGQDAGRMPDYNDREINMPGSPENLPAATSRFFDNYLNCLSIAGVPQKYHKWYVRHLELFIKTLEGHKIKSLQFAEINRYLDAPGRRKGLQSWQFTQPINAIRILYRDLLKLPVERVVEWNYWLDSAKQLGENHPTTARQLSPEDRVRKNLLIAC